MGLNKNVGKSWIGAVYKGTGAICSPSKTKKSDCAHARSPVRSYTVLDTMCKAREELGPEEFSEAGEVIVTPDPAVTLTVPAPACLIPIIPQVGRPELAIIVTGEAEVVLRTLPTSVGSIV